MICILNRIAEKITWDQQTKRRYFLWKIDGKAAHFEIMTFANCSLFHGATFRKNQKGGNPSLLSPNRMPILNVQRSCKHLALFKRTDTLD